MYNNSNELEALEIFRQKKELFPMTVDCLESEAGRMQAVRLDGVGETPEAPDLDVIWAGLQDGKGCVLCQLTAKPGGRVNSFFAKAIDKNQQEISRANFVSFGTDRAYAKLEIPRDIFHECSVQMQTAAVNERGVAAANQRVVSLEDLYIGELEIQYQIADPIADPIIKGEHKRIRINYYTYGTKDGYDYAYPGIGGGEDQMYLPSGGTIRIKDKELREARMKLMVSNGDKRALHELKRTKYPGEPEIRVEDERIMYRFAEKWKGVRLTDCLGTGYSEMINYLLRITALTKYNRKIIMLVTNIKDICTQIGVDSIGEIPVIEAQLDCFGQGTMIRMADGSQKAVEELKAGEMVQTRDGGSASVKEVKVQDERQLLGLYLDNGETVFLTDGHAVNTANGIYPVYRLREGQDVITEHGTGKICQILPKCERRYTVYSLSLEGDEEWLYAGGMMVHSSDGTELFQDRDWVREDLPEAWRKDYDNALNAGLLYGR